MSIFTLDSVDHIIFGRVEFNLVSQCRGGSRKKFWKGLGGGIFKILGAMTFFLLPAEGICFLLLKDRDNCIRVSS